MIWDLIVAFLETFGKYLLAGLALAGIAAVWRFVFRKRVRNPEADDSESSPAEKLVVPRESVVEAPGAAANASPTEGAGMTRADSPEAQEPVREASQRDEAAGSLRGASRRDEFRMWLVVVALACFGVGLGTGLIVGMSTQDTTEAVVIPENGWSLVDHDPRPREIRTAEDMKRDMARWVEDVFTRGNSKSMSLVPDNWRLEILAKTAKGTEIVRLPPRRLWVKTRVVTVQVDGQGR